jgi:ribosomal protein L11 methyltransferase
MTDLENPEIDSIWKITIISQPSFLPSLEEIMLASTPENYPSITAFEIEDNPDFKIVEVYFNVEPDINAIESSISEMAKIFNIEPPKCDMNRMEDKDWVTESQKLLKPIEAGCFYLYGSHDAQSIPPNKVSILMEAGQAFGTGSHETTNGCLLAINRLADEVSPEKILDMGCGSGILAIAMAKVWKSKIVASDIDPIATETTLENLKSNSINTIDINADESGVATIISDGFEDDAITKNGPFDLIVANILAEPLQELAPDIVKNLKKDGLLILSGLLKIQDVAVRNAYEKFNLSVCESYPINEWQTLVLKGSN